jgi:hypothetical protein
LERKKKKKKKEEGVTSLPFIIFNSIKHFISFSSHLILYSIIEGLAFQSFKEKCPSIPKVSALPLQFCALPQL